MKNILSKISIILFFFLFLHIPTLKADIVRPSTRVVDGAIIRSQPSTNSARAGILKPGEKLPYLGFVPGWNIVRLNNGASAYISKSWSIVVPESTSGDYTIHTVDVGTGLAIIVQGVDFTLVYDGGSLDDTGRGSDNRLLAYLKAMNPSLTKIDHLILSHPQQDHVELLPDLFDEYEVSHVWDAGSRNPICGYRSFIKKVKEETGVSYHTALSNFGKAQVSFPAQTCYGDNLSSETFSVESGSRINDQPVILGAGASMTFLYADFSDHNDPHENSIVVRLDLGQKRLLLVGDAGAGKRSDPQSDPTPNSTEGILLNCCAGELKADVLVVGNHGSLSASRSAFLDAVGADTFIISSGPTRYDSVVLPDDEIITELTSRGNVYRTDDDIACGTNAGKIGTDNDNKPGGCSNIRTTISKDGTIKTSYWMGTD